ncbi:MAG: hypothetical protein FWC27_03180 [Firmicutes bacterium]|nr:hypothetical protein [Bacillota bacterium]
MRFIYTFDPEIVASLFSMGYELIYFNESEERPMWVFDNPSGTDPEIEGHLYVPSDTITF